MSDRILTIYMATTLMVMVLVCNGCTTSLIVSGASAAPSGATYIGGHGGKIESYQAVTFEDTIKATMKAVETLSLNVEQENIDDNRVWFKFADNSENMVDVAIERRTATMTYLTVDTGLGGAHGMGRLLMRQILLEISDAGDLLE